MSTRKSTDINTCGESQKSTSTISKTKQKKASNASDSPPGPINLTKKSVKKPTLSQKTLKTEQKNVKTAKVVKKNDKETEDSDEKKDLVKKSVKPKLKEKLSSKIVKKPVVKKGKNSSSGNNEKIDKLLKIKKPVKKSEDKEEKKSKDKVKKDKKVKEVKKKPIPKPLKKSIDEVDSIKSRSEIKSDKKDKPKKTKAIAKNKVKINSAKKIDDKPTIECMDVVKDENPDDVALLQVFQLKNGPVCDFDGSVCNTITIRQDNTCIKIKEISVSQLPYSVKTEENEKTDIAPVKKEAKHNTENQNIEKQNSDQHKTEKQKTEKLKNEKQKSEKEKEKKEKQKIEKSVAKTVKVEKKKKLLAVDKIKPKAKTKVAPKTKVKGRPVAKRPRVASLNAIAKVHCLYENESKSALIDAMAASAAATINAPSKKGKKKSDVEIPARKGKRTSKRTTPGLKSVGRHWDMHDTSSTNSSSSGKIYLVNIKGLKIIQINLQSHKKKPNRFFS